MFYHTKTLEEIEEQMDFESISDDDVELGNIPALVSIPMYDDTSPEEDEYVEMSNESFQSAADMNEYNQKFKVLNKEIKKYEEMINEKETEIKQAVAADRGKVESQSVPDASDINNDQATEDASSIAITIPELISSIPHRFQDSSPDDQEYNQLKSDFVNKINDEINVFHEARKRLKIKNI